METSTVKLNLVQTPNDLRPFYFKTYKSMAAFSALYNFALLMVIYVVVAPLIEKPLSSGMRALALGAVIGLPLLSIAWWLFELEKQVRAKASKRPILLEANADGISTSEEYRTATLAWTAYQNAYEDKKRFVFTAAEGGLLIPKRCFESEEDIELFRKLAAAGMNAPVEKR